VEAAKRLLLAATAVVAGVAISVSGPVGFVGLLIPHLFRLLLGPDHRVLLPASILGGALFLILCDLAGRVLAVLSRSGWASSPRCWAARISCS
jgi:iron complex transport system permease protein